MEKKLISSSIILGLLLGSGIAFSGYWIGSAIIQTKAYNRFVVVKGLAERTVKANQVIWPLSYKLASNNLSELHKLIKEKNLIIQEFLLKNQLKAAEISFASPRINDLEVNYYGDNKKKFRYIATATVTIRSENVDLVKNLQGGLGELINQGIVIADDYSQQIQYNYTDLNKIKPAMIEEATKNAREAAEKFALDSGSKLGKIKNAYQGFFSINDIDSYTPEIKKVRVVTSVEYLLAED